MGACPLASRVTIQSHCGELLQGRLGPDGPVALVSLPAPPLTVTVTRQRGGAFGLHQPQGRSLCPKRISQLFKALRVTQQGRFTLHRQMESGAGCGSSTAALLALARAAGSDLPPQAMARVLWQIEGASDPLMFDAPERLLWASREGRVLARLPAVPKMRVIAGLAGEPQRTDPTDMNFADIADLVAEWQRGADAGHFAQLSTRCAIRHLSHRGITGDRTEALAQNADALGFAIAYTGSARALLLPWNHDAQALTPMLRAAGWRRICDFPLGSGPPTRSEFHDA